MHHCYEENARILILAKVLYKCVACPFGGSNPYVFFRNVTQQRWLCFINMRITKLYNKLRKPNMGDAFLWNFPFLLLETTQSGLCIGDIEEDNYTHDTYMYTLAYTYIHSMYPSSSTQRARTVKYIKDKTNGRNLAGERNHEIFPKLVTSSFVNLSVG